MHNIINRLIHILVPALKTVIRSALASLCMIVLTEIARSLQSWSRRDIAKPMIDYRHRKR